MKKKYFIQQFLGQEYMHGGITCVDAEKVLAAKGFLPIAFPYQHDFSLKAKIGRLFGLFKTIFQVKRGSVVVFIFPVYARMNKLLLRLLGFKGITLLCIIADIEGIRDADKKLLETEVLQLNRCRFFIVHNRKMEALFEQIVPGCIYNSLYFFDFLTPPVLAKRSKGSIVVFAGNLQKSKFLLDLDKISQTNLHFNIYGPDFPQKITQFRNVTYQGIYKPYDMPGVVQGSFGLIWDGESIDSCKGGYGEYLHYNSQHKLSLYILSSLPIIVWEEAATAELINEYKIGFTVKSLHEIEEKINSLSEDEYSQMQINMQPLAEKISKGECLGKAIEVLLGKIEVGK